MRSRAVIVGATRPGDFGIKVAHRAAILVQNRGGFPTPHLEEQRVVMHRTHVGAIRKLCAVMGWAPDGWLEEYHRQKRDADKPPSVWPGMKPEERDARWITKRAKASAACTEK